MTYKNQNIYGQKVMVMVRDNSVPSIKRQRILSSKDIFDLYRHITPYFNTLDREVFLMICLDGKNRTMFQHQVSVGCVTSSIVHPREVFKAAILGNAVSLIFMHNHPSMSCDPSPEDVEITKRLVACGELMGIKVLDHLIIGDNYFSFADNGLL